MLPAYDPGRDFLVMKRTSAARMREEFARDLPERSLAGVLIAALRDAEFLAARDTPQGRVRRYRVRFTSFDTEAVVELTDGVDREGRRQTGPPTAGPHEQRQAVFVTWVSFKEARRCAS